MQTHHDDEDTSDFTALISQFQQFRANPAGQELENLIPLETDSEEFEILSDLVPEAFSVYSTEAEYEGEILLTYFDFASEFHANKFSDEIERITGEIGHLPVVGPCIFPHDPKLDKNGVGRNAIAVNFATKGVGVTVLDFALVAHLHDLYREFPGAYAVPEPVAFEDEPVVNNLDDDTDLAA